MQPPLAPRGTVLLCPPFSLEIFGALQVKPSTQEEALEPANEREDESRGIELWDGAIHSPDKKTLKAKGMKIFHYILEKEPSPDINEGLS